MDAFDKAVADGQAARVQRQSGGTGSRQGTTVETVLEQLAAEGAPAGVLDHLITPLLAAYPKQSKLWAAEIIRGLAAREIATGVLQWAARDIQTECEFPPKQQQVIDGILARDSLARLESALKAATEEREARLAGEWDAVKSDFIEKLRLDGWWRECRDESFARSRWMEKQRGGVIEIDGKAFSSDDLSLEIGRRKRQQPAWQKHKARTTSSPCSKTGAAIDAA
jgi:hypothetical protein